jgi:hypothetical protein
VSAQLELPRIIPNWIMDDRYYYRKIPFNGIYIHTIFLDTNPCDSYFVQNDPKYWDPCGSQYPTCALNSNDDDFEGPCQFHQNILTQNCSTQYEWFVSLITTIYNNKSDLDWIIVVGHHPVYEITEQPFPAVIDKYADLYINGHTHLLNHYSINNGDAKYITTGSAGMVTVGSASLKDEHNNTREGDPLRYSTTTHHIQWTEKVAGFTLHRISNSGTTLTTDFIKYDGTTIYSFDIQK